jgi:hypothetical protein
MKNDQNIPITQNSNTQPKIVPNTQDYYKNTKLDTNILRNTNKQGQKDIEGNIPGSSSINNEHITKNKIINYI